MKNLKGGVANDWHADRSVQLQHIGRDSKLDWSQRNRAVEKHDTHRANEIARLQKTR